MRESRFLGLDPERKLHYSFTPKIFTQSIGPRFKDKEDVFLLSKHSQYNSQKFRYDMENEELEYQLLSN